MRGLQVDTIIAVVSLIATIMGGFAIVVRRMARLELKVEMMYEWFTQTGPHRQRGGRRSYDIPIGNGDE